MLPFASVFVSCTGSAVVFVTLTFAVPTSWTLAGLVLVLATTTLENGVAALPEHEQKRRNQGLAHASSSSRSRSTCRR